jgi:hypothetical protein
MYELGMYRYNFMLVATTRFTLYSDKRLSSIFHLLQAPGVYGKVDDENSIKLLNTALDIGCNFWDTASM